MLPVTIRLDSHMLSDFQRCMARGNYAFVMGLRKKPDPTRKDKVSGMDKGTAWHKLMEYRSLAMQKHKDFARLLPVARRYLKRTFPNNKTVQTEILTRFLDYQAQYSGDSWEVLATEKGFSKVLWENEDVRFVYEGLIDLIVRTKDGLEYFIDHKTQNPRFTKDLLQDCNQFLGYAWASGIRNGIVDYTTWSTKVGKTTFRRPAYYYSENKIEQWREDTIYWFWRILEHLRTQHYPRTRGSCDEKYGPCSYYEICKRTNEASQLMTIKTKYDVEPRWEPWT